MVNRQGNSSRGDDELRTLRVLASKEILEPLHPNLGVCLHLLASRLTNGIIKTGSIPMNKNSTLSYIVICRWSGPGLLSSISSFGARSDLTPFVFNPAFSKKHYLLFSHLSFSLLSDCDLF